MVRMWIFLFVVSISFQCKESAVLGLPTSVSLFYQQQSVRQIGESFWKLEFTEIKENSLCPPESVCVWPGRLVATVVINGLPYTLAIGDLQSGDPSEDLTPFVIVDGVKVHLLAASGLDEPVNSTIELRLSAAD